jgi:hypothetical protein
MEEGGPIVKMLNYKLLSAFIVLSLCLLITAEFLPFSNLQPIKQ